MYIQTIFKLILLATIATAEGSLLCTKRNSNLPIKENGVQLKDQTLDCINSIMNGSTMYTICSRNDLFLIPTENLVVIGELKSKNEEFDESQSTVVITTEKVNLNNLKGLKYCHPGGNVQTLPWVTNEFITTILNNSINSKSIPSNRTLLEHNYFLLNSNLGPSCIQNTWSVDENLNNSLRELYPKLFELCPKYKSGVNPFEQSLQCLIDGHGNIALTSLEKVEEYKEILQSEGKEYFSLCKNNTLQDLNNLCVWKTSSWPLLIRNKNYTYDFRDVDETIRNFTSFSGWSIYNESVYPSKILNENIILNNTNVQHKKTLVWCTLTQKENDDCELLQKAFILYDIPVKITSCETPEEKDLDKYACIKNIKSGISNIIFLHSDQFFAAKRAELEISLYTDTGSDLIKSILFVNTNAIKTIEDLENKKGCFSEFGSIDWFSFVSAFKRKILKDSCFYDLELSKFVNESCMPGIRDDLRLRNDHIDVERLCEICKPSSNSSTDKNCNADQNVNIFATNKGAMDCLMKAIGQFAVIKLDNNFNMSSTDIKEGIMVMCKNGTLIEFKEIDDECYLSLAPYGGIVTKKGLEEDVKLAFFELKQRNLQYGLLPYDIFNSLPDLFSDRVINEILDISTCDINITNNSCKHIRELDSLIQATDTCSATSKRSDVKPINTKSMDTTTEISQISKSSSIGFIALITALSCLGICIIALVFWYIKKYHCNTEESSDVEFEIQMEPLNVISQNANHH